MAATPAGTADLRKENIARAVTGFALKSYVFKGSCLVESSNSWKETYFEETAADLTASGTRNIEGISRFAKFPSASVTFQERSNRQKKYGVQDEISWEDWQMSDINILARTLLRIGRAVAASVDAEIWDVITESQAASPARINELDIAAGSEWDSADLANQNPIQNVLDAIKEIEESNYDVGTAELWVNPKDKANLMGNASIRNAGQFWTDDVTRNGNVGRLAGATVKSSNNVTAGYAAIVIPKVACTWKTGEALKTETIKDPGIKWTIRSWEIGVAQLKNPKAVTLISNTAA